MSADSGKKATQKGKRVAEALTESAIIGHEQLV